MVKEDVKMEIIFKPSIPNNVDHWQVFSDDGKVINFSNNMHEFDDFEISHKEEGCHNPENDQQINSVPRKVVSYERFFDRDDGCKKKEEKSLKNGEHIEINIGSENDKSWKEHPKRGKGPNS